MLNRVWHLPGCFSTVRATAEKDFYRRFQKRLIAGCLIMTPFTRSIVRQSRRGWVGDDRGSIAIQFAFAMVPLIGLVGGAVDFGRAYRIDAKLQAGLDAAVLAAARDNTDEWQAVADRTFSGNVDAAFRLGASPSFSRDDDGGVTGSIAVTLPTSLIKLVGDPSIPVTVNSVASSGKIEDNSCILSLGQGSSVSTDSITFNGAPNIQLNQCTLRSNTSMRCNGHGGGSVASISAGTVNGCTNPQPNSDPVPDIYAALATNITPSCGGSRPGGTWSPGIPPAGLTPQNKGSYSEYHVCGDLTLSGSGYLTGSAPASDTVIVVENGSLNLANDAAISTKRVAIVLTGNNSYASTINFPNGNGHAASLSLSPPTSQGNPWRGISVYQRSNSDQCRQWLGTWRYIEPGRRGVSAALKRYYERERCQRRNRMHEVHLQHIHHKRQCQYQLSSGRERLPHPGGGAMGRHSSLLVAVAPQFGEGA